MTNNSRKLTDQEAMTLAIEEGQKGIGLVSPNPPVGAVILDRHGHLLSKGHHKKAGGPHAEIEALENISSEQLKGAHLFVTLEPCAHEGKTPSCAKQLAKLPLASVTYGQVDPNPLVSGKGLEIIKAAKIEVKKAVGFERELEELAEVFLFNMRERKPFVALKVAASLDGQIVRNDRPVPQWLTGSVSRERVHLLRAHHDAIVVGRGTIDTDNPQLNVRHPSFANKSNKVVILDVHGRTIPMLTNLNVYRDHSPEDLTVVMGREAAEALARSTPKGVNLLAVETDSSGDINIPEMLDELYKRGFCSVLVEGGARVFSRFLRVNAVQRLYLFLPPLILGAGRSRSWTEELAGPGENIHLDHMKIDRFGEDLMLTGRIPSGFAIRS